MADPSLELIHKQQKELEAFEIARVRRFMALLESSRKDIRAAITDAMDGGLSTARLQGLLKQLDAIAQSTGLAILAVAPSNDRLEDMVARHATGSIDVLYPGKILVADLGRITPSILVKFAENNMALIKSVNDLQMQVIRQALFSKVGVEGQNPRKVAEQLAGPDGIFKGQYARIENIISTEASTIYNAQHLEAISNVNASGLSLNKRIVETIDRKRNHPISPLINNQVQAVGKLYRVKVADVVAKARSLGRGAKRSGGVSGIFWTQQDGYYVGNNLPAHYRERGTITPTRQDINAI